MSFLYSDSNKRYHTYSYAMRRRFGGKVMRVSLNAGFTCPNIDGTKGRGGCVFCSQMCIRDRPVQDWDTLLQSVVVLANPKTVIQDANAPAEIRDKIIKHDQLINHLKKLQEANTGVLLSEQEMRAIADILVSAHQERQFTPPANYRFTVPLCPKCNVPMVRRTAKKGANQGNEFFGCPNFPKCRQIINID